ncbi:outer membrane beta-barrel protein [Duganella sp. FT92W]|uniref:Outer membrane beta-barrel protein n=1 Tax=Pseudoduganella rivuli TaxID=2666085 RepID=A0A7X2IK14_9BURK|nr:OmpW family outer membrane protein [Pseudoduganella rivuli]MRV71260.1 outer membrane beta-barrel protein [Pseudoduganella rivuli]
MNIRLLASMSVLALASGGVLAQDTTIGLGAAHIFVNAKSPNLSSNGPAFLTPQPAGIDVKDATTVLITVTRRLDDHWYGELALGVPPRQEVIGAGTLAPFGVIAKVKQAAPTAFLNYRFGAAGSALRPFVGVGLNYTRFYDAASTTSGSLASGGPTKIQLSKSTGLAAQAGVNYQFDKTWSLCLSVIAADVESDMTATTGSIERKTHIKFNPRVLGVAVGYSF